MTHEATGAASHWPGDGDERCRALFEQSAVGIGYASADGDILAANGKLCAMLGYAADELIGRSIFDVMHAEDRASADEYRRRLLSLPPGDASGRNEVRFIRKDGATGWAHIAVSLIRDGSGSPDYFIAVVEDVTQRKADERDLKYKNSVFAAQLNTSLDAILLVDENGMVAARNRRFLEMWRIPEELANCKDDGRLIDHVLSQLKDPEQFLSRLRRLYECRMEHSFEEIELLDGRTLERYSGPVVSPDGAYYGRVWYFRDISERRRTELAMRTAEGRFRAIFEHAGVGISMRPAHDRTLPWLQVNDRFCEMLGYTREELLKLSTAAITHPDEQGDAVADNQRLLRGEIASYTREKRLARKDGSYMWVILTVSSLPDGEGRPEYIMATYQDISERKRSEERLVQLAHYDALTGLPNRVLFHDLLKQTLRQARRGDGVTGVLFIDLDRFKMVNDTLGHALGDELLRQTAARLTHCVRSGDTVGRLGGDEFAVILSDLAAPQDAGLVAQKILDALASSFLLDGNEVFVSASIGITLYPSDGGDVGALIRNADAAMFSAKEHGRNTYRFFTAEMNQRMQEKMRVENGLRRALERNEFVLHYQPKVDLASGEVCGIEALLRWQRNGNGLVAPDCFVPALEETGLIVPVGEWVLREVLTQIAAWQRAGLKALPVAVNISARQLQHADFEAMLRRLLDETGVDPRWLDLEITESLLMANPDEARTVFVNLCRLGVRLSVDDFGTGYSSLARLKRLPLHALKIDRSFVRDIATDTDDAAITRSVVLLAHSLNLKVVAEGVEDEEQLAFLRANGCDEAQGYLFSRPLPAGACTELLGSGRRLPAPAGPDSAAGPRRERARGAAQPPACPL
jgi:diguanylate cyclase (GGDEF)-like protein/PAS domain S-box-containing protein